MIFTCYKGEKYPFKFFVIISIRHKHSFINVSKTQYMQFQISVTIYFAVEDLDKFVMNSLIHSFVKDYIRQNIMFPGETLVIQKYANQYS